MSARLVNVRLDEERIRKAQKLREKGIALSDLVREAIDERFEEVTGPRATRDVKAAIARIFVQFPDPPELPPRTYDVHDRRAARAAIVEKLRRGRA